jgi:hypothetical protein
VLGIARHVRGVQQVVWIAIDAVGSACLEQQDGAGWIFAETAGEDAARRASSNDDYIGATVAAIGHGSRSPRWVTRHRIVASALVRCHHQIPVN